ncbi:hypothetical protein M8542_40010 [Amycolatopsis sp. OK19-0408]|uniref:Uncharacterized protein n=1 Tax=Amycolatopsis iheyensis TaxID=2945988 RepID=A0A9X2NMF5_9PSEU|nr:hypothetical protein [Amycolatopsis iheyensis]MCR6489032.1 hypothetical protein [Amycolatopsis iheyensis]
MGSLLIGIAGAVAAALVTGLLTYFVTAWKVRHELHVEYDRGLRSQRLKAYAELWSWTQSFSRYRPTAVTGDGAAELIDRLTDWYFQGGGMYLSAAAREKYFAFMNSLKKAAERTGSDGALGTVDFRVLQRRTSELRTQITKDVGTREPPLYPRLAG